MNSVYLPLYPSMYEMYILEIYFNSSAFILSNGYLRSAGVEPLVSLIVPEKNLQKVVV